MRCPDCNKFVSYADGDPAPEVESIDVDEDGQVTATVTRTLTCGECGTELKSASLELMAEPGPDVTEHLAKKLRKGKTHELAVEADEPECCDRTEGTGRYMKTFYGAQISYTITCACDDKWSVTGSFSDDCPASGMDELV